MILAKSLGKEPPTPSFRRVGQPAPAQERRSEVEADRAAAVAVTGGMMAASSLAFGLGTQLQRKCDCGGTCENCDRDANIRIQRKPNDSDGSDEAAPFAGKANVNAPVVDAQPVLVEDGDAVDAAQMNRTPFLAELRPQLFAICDLELAAVGRSAEGCPFLTRYLDDAEGRSAVQLERVIRLYTRTSANTPQTLMDAIVSRVRDSVRTWVATGQVSSPDSGAEMGDIPPATTDATPSVQTKRADGASVPVNTSPTGIRAQLGVGRGLDPGIRGRMESGFGVSFAGVRVHTDSTAQRLASGLSARAFTIGKDVAFDAGEYRPGTTDGDFLIAHELAHTVQQSGARTEALGASDADLESDADRSAFGAVTSGLGFTLPRPGQQRSGLRLQRCGRSKPKLDFEHWTEKQRKSFVLDNFTESDRPLANAVMQDLFDSAAALDFDNQEELRREIFKRVRTSQLMQKSQDLYGKAFEYPNSKAARACRVDKSENPRVNKAAEKYWGPAQAPDGNYFFELTSEGRKKGYTALTTLFVPQNTICERTLIHCDYLASVIHFRAFADSIGEPAFNDLVSSGKIPMILRWNGFTDLEDIGFGHSSEATSLQEVRPASEKDLIIGDHVIFWNHRAYDLINEQVHNAWRLENAILVDRKGDHDNFLGHGSGRKTNKTMRKKLAEEYNDVIKMAQNLITKTKSKTGAPSARSEMTNRFPNIKEDKGQWKITGKSHGKTFDDPVKETTPDNPELTGLKDPEDPSQMGQVKRPIESAPP